MSHILVLEIPGVALASALGSGETTAPERQLSKRLPSPLELIDTNPSR
jgi:hypothetical protein